MGIVCEFFTHVNLLVIVTNVHRIDGRRFVLLPDLVNQSAATLACAAQGLKISDPKTMEGWWDMVSFMNEVEDGTHQGWTGLQDEFGTNTWLWSDGTQITNVEIWKADKPDKIGVERCARLTSDRYLSNLRCSALRRPICECDESLTVRAEIVHRIREDGFPTVHPLTNLTSSSRLTCMVACLKNPRCVSYAVTGGQDVTCWMYNSIVTSFRDQMGASYYAQPCLKPLF